MDIPTLIVNALAAGASTGLQQTTGTAIKDTYNGLITLIRRKIADKPKAQDTLADFETDPATYEKPFRKVLLEAQIDPIKDNDIIEAANKLMTLIQPQQAGMGKYTIQNTGTIQGQAIGDHPTITQYIGHETKE